ncbi:uncharacterized protein LOC113167164 [Anabas testudineus]|uniref:uncharacterized protein LOC113167164 n=1 Tax=Anabas testudineus TaxID=64144 RepID=UPI000E45C5B4|nr:uncharacterized protein LOC113167164 [Anabas testudineus]
MYNFYASMEFERGLGGGSARTDANEAPAAPAAPVRTCPLISTQRGCYCVATVKWPLHNGITRRLAGYIVYVSGVSTYCSPLQEHERQRSHPQQLTSLASNPRVHLGLHVSAKRNKKEQKKKKKKTRTTTLLRRHNTFHYTGHSQSCLQCVPSASDITVFVVFGSLVTSALVGLVTSDEEEARLQMHLCLETPMISSPPITNRSLLFDFTYLTSENAAGTPVLLMRSSVHGCHNYPFHLPDVL